MAFTFDDGPGPETDLLLDCLEEHGARATLFVIGEHVAGNEDTLRRAVALGCELANHSHTHRFLSELSDAEVAADLTACSDAIEAATGVRPTLMRPPVGALGPTTLAVVDQVGLSPVLWSIRGMDFDGEGPVERIVDAIVGNARPGGVPILHDGAFRGSGPAAAPGPGGSRQPTIDAMRQAVPRLIADGYALVTVTELLSTNAAARAELIATSPEMARALLPAQERR